MRREHRAQGLLWEDAEVNKARGTPPSGSAPTGIAPPPRPNNARFWGDLGTDNFWERSRENRASTSPPPTPRPYAGVPKSRWEAVTRGGVHLRLENWLWGGCSISRWFGTGHLGVGASSRVLPRGVTSGKCSPIYLKSQRLFPRLCHGKVSV